MSHRRHFVSHFRVAYVCVLIIYCPQKPARFILLAHQAAASPLWVANEWKCDTLSKTQPNSCAVQHGAYRALATVMMLMTLFLKQNSPQRKKSRVFKISHPRLNALVQESSKQLNHTITRGTENKPRWWFPKPQPVRNLHVFLQLHVMYVVCM